MKRLSLLFGIITILFTLSACGLFQGDQPVTIELNHNLDPAELEDDGPRLSVKPENNIIVGQEITITASTYPGYQFVEWRNQDGTSFSTQPVTRFVVEASKTLTAVYEAYEVGYFNVTAFSNINEPIHLSQEGPFVPGTRLTITAPPVEGYTFDHFRDVDSGRLITRQQNYTFDVNQDRTIEAIYLEEDTFFVVFETNIDGIIPIVSHDGPYVDGEEVTVEAPLVPNHGFIHWQTEDGTIISYETIIEYTVTQSEQVIAIYNETALIYETGFEDVDKPSFARGTIETRGHLWTLHEALIGSSHLDRRVGEQGVRLRSGYIESVFAVQHIERITFKYATFGESEPSSIRLLISQDKVSWYLVEATTAQPELRTFEHVFNDEDLAEYGLTISEPLYVRISHNPADAENLVNVDNIKIYVSEENDNIHYLNEPHIELDEDIQRYYSLDEPWDGSACTAFYLTSEIRECAVDGHVDTSTIGKYEITYYYTIDGMTASETITKTVMRDASYLEHDYSAYYEGIEGLYGEALILALRDIIQDGVTLQTYGDARDILQITDEDPNNSNNVLLMYNRASVLSTWDQGTTWNREHVWPQSRLGLSSSTNNSSRHIGSDLHNLRAINPQINSSRGNKFFDFVETATSYYPGEDRGDAARIYFYMIVMYPQLTLTDELPDPATTYTPVGAVHGYLSSLLYFHFDDPVDAFETRRNEIIYSYQNNRNPFIDYPHLIELIYWDHENLLDWFEENE